MWSILKIYIGLTFLAAYVYGFVYDDIENYIKRKKLIDNIFLPLNESACEFCYTPYAYKGVNMVDFRDVALRFSTDHLASEHEYEMYTYLNAIDKNLVKKYGISPIYYYAKYGNRALIVTPLFESNIRKKISTTHSPFKTIDFLILFRDFVRSSKYIHSRGICHNSISPVNIMLSKSRSFLINFEAASKINDIFKPADTMQYASRRLHRQINANEQPVCRRIDDWESFLYTMAKIANVKLDFLDIPDYDRNKVKELTKMIGPKKEMTNITIAQIENDIKDVHLREVMLKLADEVFKDKEVNSLPRYDDFEKLITEKIDVLIGQGQPAIFSWLEGDERNEAIKDLKQSPPATAEEIIKPRNKFRPSDYKKLGYDYFEDRKGAMAKMAVKNYRRYKMEKIISKITTCKKH